MIGDARNLGVLDELDGICAAGVFGNPGVGEIHVAIFFQHHVFQHRPVAQRLERYPAPTQASD